MIHQSRREGLKTGEGSSNLVGIICPLVEIGVTDMSICEGDRPLCSFNSDTHGFIGEVG